MVAIAALAAAAFKWHRAHVLVGEVEKLKGAADSNDGAAAKTSRYVSKQPPAKQEEQQPAKQHELLEATLAKVRQEQEASSDVMSRLKDGFERAIQDEFAMRRKKEVQVARRCCRNRC